MSNANDSSAGRELVLGVLGGMGPQATADFLLKLVQVTPATTEQDHLRVLVDSNPKVPDRNSAIAGQGASPAPVLAAMAAGLERAGADLLVMACNTAHAFEPDVGEGYRLPTPAMAEAVSLLARQEGILLDPVYSGKGMAGLIDLVRKGQFRQGENVVFVHTGGSVGLFGYPKAFD